MKISDYLKVRAVRMGVLCGLVFTFVGLPAYGQMLGTNAFQKLDVVNGTINLLSYYDMNGAWVDDGYTDYNGGTDYYYDNSGYTDPYYYVEPTPSQCTTDYNGTAIYEYETVNWPDGSWDTYGAGCNITNSYDAPSTTTPYDNTTTDDSYTNDDSGSYDYNSYDESDLCGYDSYGTSVWPGSSGRYFDSSGDEYIQWVDQDCNVTGTSYDIEGYDSSYDSYADSYYNTGYYGAGYYDEDGNWVESDDVLGGGMGGLEEDYYNDYAYSFSDASMCVVDDYGAYIYPWGMAFWDDGSYTQYDENCGVKSTGQQMSNWNAWNWVEYDKSPAQYETKYQEYFSTDTGKYQFAGTGVWEGKNLETDYAYTMEYAGQYQDKYTNFVSYGFDQDFEDYNSWGQWGDYKNDWDSKMNSSDINNKKRDFENTLDNYNFDREWDRMANRQDRLVENFDNMAGDRSREQSMWASAGYGTDGLGKSAEYLSNLSDKTKGLITEVGVLQNLYESDRTALETRINSLSSNATQADVAVAEFKSQKLEGYSVLMNAMDARVSWVENMEGVAELRSRVGKIYQSYEKAGVDVPSKVESKLEGMLDDIEKLSDYDSELETAYDGVMSEVEAMRSMTDPDSLETAIEDMWDKAEDLTWLQDDMFMDFDDFWMNDPWMEMDELEMAAHGAEQSNKMSREISTIRSEIKTASSFIDILNGMNIDKAGVKKAASELDKLANKGLEALDKMADFVNQGGHLENPEKMDSFWSTMDNLGYAADTYMEKVITYLEDNPSEVKALSEEDQAIVEEMMDTEFGGQEEYDYDSYYDNYGWDSYKGYEDYGYYSDADSYDRSRSQIYDTYTSMAFDEDFDIEDLVARISERVIEEITRRITESVMEKVAAHLNDKLSGETLELALNMADIFPSADEILNSTTSVLNVMLAEEDWDDTIDALVEEDSGLSDELNELEDLYEETKGTVIATDLTEDFEDTWGDITVDLETGGVSEETLQKYVDDAVELLANNEEALIFDEGISFYDVAFKDAEDLWYYDDVTAARADGIVNGYKDSSGDLTGYYAPGNEVNYAEALKMVYEAAGEDGASGTSSNTAAQGAWFEDYVKQAESDGLEFVNEVYDWSQPADRGTVAVWTSQVFDLEGDDTDYERVFPDVDSSDPYAGHYQAVYDYDIFTGDSGTGTLRPDDPINRAETAKVVNTASENAGSLNGLDSTFDQLIDELVSYGYESELYVSSNNESGFWAAIKNALSSVMNIF